MTDDKWDIRTLAAFQETSRMSVRRAQDVREMLERLWHVRTYKGDVNRRLGTEEKEKQKNLRDDLRRISKDKALNKSKKEKKKKGARSANRERGTTSRKQNRDSKGTQRKKRMRKALQASADDENNNDKDDAPSAAKRAKTSNPPYLQDTVIRTETEVDEALASIYQNWGIESISQDLSKALLPKDAMDDTGIDLQILAKLRDLFEVTSTPEDMREVREKLDTALKDRVDSSTEKILADIATVGDAYHYKALQQAMVDDEPFERFSDAGSSDEDQERRDTRPIRDTTLTFRDQPNFLPTPHESHRTRRPFPSIESILNNPLLGQHNPNLAPFQDRLSKAFRAYKMAEADVDVAMRQRDWLPALGAEGSEADANRKVAEKNLVLERLKGELSSLEREILQTVQQRCGGEGSGQ